MNKFNIKKLIIGAIFLFILEEENFNTSSVFQLKLLLYSCSTLFYFSPPSTVWKTLILPARKAVTFHLSDFLFVSSFPYEGRFVFMRPLSTSASCMWTDKKMRHKKPSHGYLSETNPPLPPKIKNFTVVFFTAASSVPRKLLLKPCHQITVTTTTILKRYVCIYTLNKKEQPN